MVFWCRAVSRFRCLFAKRQNLIFCNKYRTPARPSPFNASHFGIKIIRKIVFFRNALLYLIDILIYIVFMLQNEILVPLRNPVSAQMAPKITEVAPKNAPFWFPFRNLVRRSSFGCILAVLWFTCGSLLLAFGTGSEQFWERFGIKKTIKTSPEYH